MTYQEFVNKWNGKGVDFDGFYGFQCFDLAHQYAVEVNGQDIPSAPGAKDVWDKNANGYDKIANTPDGVPQQGDIVIWGQDVGPYGHIAIFDHGDTNTFVSFDQNWPVGSLCHLQNHSYKGVLGWLRHKSAVIAQQSQITDQTKIPQLEGKEVQQIKAEMDAKDKRITDLENNEKRLTEDLAKSVQQTKDFEELYKAAKEGIVSPEIPPNSINKPKSAIGAWLYDLAYKIG